MHMYVQVCLLLEFGVSGRLVGRRSAVVFTVGRRWALTQLDGRRDRATRGRAVASLPAPPPPLQSAVKVHELACSLRGPVPGTRPGRRTGHVFLPPVSDGRWQRGARCVCPVGNVRNMSVVSEDPSATEY